MQLANERVLVVGLGSSGLAAAKLLLSKGARVVANDLRSRLDLGEVATELEGLGAELVLGAHDADLFASVDRIVVSPGVPPLAALVAASEKGVPILSEVELACRFLSGRLLAVTGTNGKSTVTSILGEMCRATGAPTFVGGNLGTPLVNVVGTEAAGTDGIVVLEVSSFQLERVEKFRPHVAVLLNVTEDHLDRYDSFAAYAAAKGQIFRNQRSEDQAVVPSGDALCESVAQAGRARVWHFGGTDGDVRIEGDAIVDGHTGLSVPLGSLHLRGKHNALNACAAMLAARLGGVSPEHIAIPLKRFAGLPHRMQHVRDLDGVSFYDDSKATNVGAAIASIDGLSGIDGRVVLVAGGRHKGGSFEGLRERMERHGRAVVVLGEAASEIGDSFIGSSVPVERASSIDDSVRRARAVAQPGDIVLLAPACASFDMFRSYVHRGEEFQRAVRSLEEVSR